MLEIATTQLASGVVNAAARWFLRGEEDTNSSLSDLVNARVSTAIDRRRLLREFEQATDSIAERLVSQLRSADLPDNEAQAAVEAVRDSISKSRLGLNDILDSGLSEARVANLIRERSIEVRRAASLSESGERLYRMLLDEIVVLLIGLARLNPDFESANVEWLVRQNSDLRDQLTHLISRLPDGRHLEIPQSGHERYRRAIGSTLDRVSLAGFPIGDLVHRSPLTHTFTQSTVDVDGTSVPIEWALADNARLVLVGLPGSGKTSILRWLAVSSAARSLQGLLVRDNERLPIYISVRSIEAEGAWHLTDTDVLRLSSPSLGDHLEISEFRQLALAGSLWFLVDGLDEVSSLKRYELMSAVTEIVSRYPRCRFVLASRPHALDADEFTAAGFGIASLEPLDDSAVSDLIRRWFAELASADPRGELRSSADGVSQIVFRDARLREMARTPVMCVLICLLLRDRGRVPIRSGELIEAFLDMFIERRDLSRGITVDVGLSRFHVYEILGSVALHMLRAGRMEVSLSGLDEIVTSSMEMVSNVSGDGRELREHILRRAGLLSETREGFYSFSHSTFMEYLAARQLVEEDDLTSLVVNAHAPVWREVTVMAIGRSSRRQCDQLIEGLIGRVTQDAERRPALVQVLGACLDEAQILDVRLRELAQNCLKEVSREADRWSITLVSSRAGDYAALLSWLRTWVAAEQRGDYVLVEAAPGEASVLVSTTRRIETDLLSVVLSWHSSRPVGGRPKVLVIGPGVKVTLEEPVGGISSGRPMSSPEEAPALRVREADLQRCRESGDTAGEAAALAGLANVYDAAGDQLRALEHYNAALSIFQELQNPSAVADTLNRIGQVYFKSGEFVKALEMYETALAAVRETGDRAGEALILNNLGHVNYGMGEVLAALQSHEEALLICQELGNLVGEATTLSSLGDIYHRLGDFDRSRSRYEAALSRLHELGDWGGEAVARFNLAMLLRSSGDLDRAVRELEMVVELDRRIGHPDLKSDLAVLERIRIERDEEESG